MLFDINYLFSVRNFEQTERDKAYNHACAVSNNYEDRKQTDDEKKRDDTYLGKLGEIHVYNILKLYFPQICYPDFTIYKSSQKTWASDFNNGPVKVAVKSCRNSAYQQYKNSWIFQFKDKNGYGKDMAIFGPDAENKLCIFVKVFGKDNDSTDYTGARIRSIITLEMLHKYKLFWDHAKEELEGIKKAVYYSGLNPLGFGSNVIHSSVYSFINIKTKDFCSSYLNVNI